jgi:hypothetical protein
LATDVTLQTLTWPELDPLGVVFAAGVEVDEFAADAMPAPRPPPTSNAAPSAAHRTQPRPPPRACFDSFISVTYSRTSMALASRAKSTYGSPLGAFGGSKGDQPGTESRMSTLIVPLNGSRAMQASVVIRVSAASI